MQVTAIPGKMPLGEPNLFGLHQYDNKTSFFGGDTLFSPGVGYGIVCGFGTLFALLTILMMHIDKKYAGSVYHSEEFNTAGRAIKTGLTAVDVVSRSTWVASIVVTSNVAYQWGVSGAFWYGAGVVAQLGLFGAIALQLKRRAPKAHTVVELVRRRWGGFASFAFMYVCVLCNVIICSLLIIASGNLLVAATGMNAYAAFMLIPITIIVYAVTGGLKAIFFSSYLHTVVICITMNVFCFAVYASGKAPIGSISRVWENLTLYAKYMPVAGNRDGSYVTMFSREAFKFGMYNFLNAFGIICADQSFWQGVIAAGPKASFKGYVLGSLLWLPIPMAMATALGLSVRALDLPVTLAEANAGLVPMAAAQFLLGSVGVILLLTIVFMAVTSVGSAEFLSMSSIFTYDIFKAYVKPNATGEQMLFMSRCAVGFVGLTMGGLTCILYKVNVDVNFIFLVMGLLVSSAGVPLLFMLTWPQVPAPAAVTAVLVGQLSGIATWLIVAQVKFHELTISFSLQQLDPGLSGNLVCIVVSAIIVTAWTLVAPGDPESFLKFQEIELMDGVKVHDVDSSKTDNLELKMFFRKTFLGTVGIAVGICFVWPLLALPAGVFSKEYFTFWVLISLAGAITTTVVCTFLPLVESRKVIIHTIMEMWRQLSGSVPADTETKMSLPTEGEETHSRHQNPIYSPTV